MNKKKKILILGAGSSQVPLITRALEFGYYTIICSYDRKEPGAELAHEFFEISVTDKKAVLKLAEDKNVELVISHGSDVAAPTAAYVSEILHLQGNPFETVQMMTDKGMFRSFLKEHEFNVPEFITINESGRYLDSYLMHNLPLLVKPVDSSGGRGISKVNGVSDLENALSVALKYSDKNTVIVEEFIETNFNQVHGNGFVLDGKLAFSHLGDHHFSLSNEIIPVATSWPSKLSEELQVRIEKEVNRFVRLSDFRFGPINIEARIDKKNRIYMIELAPRTAVNFVEELTRKATGVDTTLQLFNYLNGNKVDLKIKRTGYVAYYLVHSGRDGTLNKTIINPDIEKYISERNFTKKPGDRVFQYRNMTDSTGILLFNFGSSEVMDSVMRHINEYVTVVVE